MTAARLAESPAARRALALLVLALVLWIVAPFFTGPLDRWREGRQAVADESALAERLARLDARRSAVASLAARPDAPFIVAPDAAMATGLLVNRIMAAAPQGAMRVEGIAADTTDPRPGAPVRLRFTFTATQGAFAAFLADVETRSQLVRIDELVASPVSSDDGTITLTGSAAVSSVALMRAAP